MSQERSSDEVGDTRFALVSDTDLRPEDVTVLRDRFGRVRGYRVASSALERGPSNLGSPSIQYLDESGRTVTIAVRDLWACEVRIRAFACNIDAALCCVISREEGHNAYLTKSDDSVDSFGPEIEGRRLDY